MVCLHSTFIYLIIMIVSFSPGLTKAYLFLFCCFDLPLAGLWCPKISSSKSLRTESWQFWKHLNNILLIILHKCVLNKLIINFDLQINFQNDFVRSIKIFDTLHNASFLVIVILKRSFFVEWDNSLTAQVVVFDIKCKMGENPFCRK